MFGDRYGRPGKGNDKGKVEGMVGFARRTFMVPFPRARDFADLNAMLEERCRERQARILRGATTTMGARMTADQAVFEHLPATPFDACDKRPGRGHQSGTGSIQEQPTTRSLSFMRTAM